MTNLVYQHQNHKTSLGHLQMLRYSKGIVNLSSKLQGPAQLRVSIYGFLMIIIFEDHML